MVFTIDQNADEDFYICEMTAPETVDGTVTRVNKNNDSDNAYLFLDRETKYDYSDHMAYDLNDETAVQHPEPGGGLHPVPGSQRLRAGLLRRHHQELPVCPGLRRGAG